MQHAARLSAAIEILDEIEAALAAPSGLPSDTIIANYFRARRYAGGGDRRFVTGLVYGVLRMRELCLYCVEAKTTGRSLLIAYLAIAGEDLNAFGGEGKFDPEALSGEEQAIIAKAQALDIAAISARIAHNVPDWAEEGFKARFGDDFTVAAEALNQTAPLDIRENTLKKNTEVPEGFERTQFSPIGWRSQAHVQLGQNKAYKSGQIEVQDEAAQIASLMVGAKPGDQVADLCAGAGGKSLAVAGQMQNKGQIFAFDIHGGRLNALKKRAGRAGVRNIQTKLLSDDNREDVLSALAGKMDKVIVDVPCTGSGTWRRSPDQRWRFDEESLKALNALQTELLNDAMQLVKPGGVIAYMTCSVLPQENEQIISNVMHEYIEFNLLKYKDYCSLLNSIPETLSSEPYCLQLAPHSHQTDGFFIALIERNNA